MMTEEEWRKRRKDERQRRYLRDGGTAAHASHLRFTYGLTGPEYDAMLREQDGVCAICRMPEDAVTKTGKAKRLAVDHCHATGRVRALLCARCNLKVGIIEKLLEDNHTTLDAVRRYIEEWQATFANGAPL